MMQLSSKNNGSSLCYDVIITLQKILIDEFDYFSSKTEIFRAISVIINQCGPRRPKGASGGYKVSASRAAQASEARLYIYTLIGQKYLKSLLLFIIILTIKTRLMYIYLFIYKRASLAWAARLTDTLCPPEAPFERLGSH